LVRNPYLRTIFYKEDKEIFDKRFFIIRTLREILWEKEFIEVETPILQTHYGGALAKPFRTYLEALRYAFIFKNSSRTLFEKNDCWWF